jgi:hypothetical protein
VSDSSRSEEGGSIEGKSLFVPVAIRGVNTLELIWHAQERMKERGVTQDDVIRSLREPDEVTPCKDQPGRREAVRNKTARVQLKVVFEEFPDRVRVITVKKKQRRISGRR